MRLINLLHILSPKTDKCPFLNQPESAKRERTTVENIFLINLHERLLQTRRGSSPQPPNYQADADPTKPPRPAICKGRGVKHEIITKYHTQKFYKNILQVVGYQVVFLEMFITKTYLYKFDPLKPHFYIVKLGFTWVCIIFLISAQIHRFWTEIWKI